MPTCPFCSREVPLASSVCPHCLRGLPISVTAARPSAAKSVTGVTRGRVRPALLLVALLAVGGYGLRAYRTERSKPEPVRLAEGETAPLTGPVTTTIAPPLEVPIVDTVSVSIPVGGHLSYTFSGGGRAGCRVRGEVKTLPGGDRQVDVMVVDRDGLADVESGKTPRTYYESGATSDVTLDVNLDGRTQYTLVVQHAGSGRRATTVRLRGVAASCAD